MDFLTACELVHMDFGWIRKGPKLADFEHILSIYLYILYNDSFYIYWYILYNDSFCYRASIDNSFSTYKLKESPYQYIGIYTTPSVKARKRGTLWSRGLQYH